MSSRIILLGLLSACLITEVMAQSTLRGTVKNKETGDPIASATIFIEHTTVGTTSNLKGEFELKNIPSGFNKVVVSHIGYKTYTAGINGVASLDIQLETVVRNLAEVGVKAKQDRLWKRLYNQFEKSFLGNTLNGKQSKILNPWVVELNRDKNGTISGYSTDLIQIENKGTGYLVHFLLENVQIMNKQIIYAGKPLFTPLEPSSNAEKVQWENNRKRTYLGSRQHFIHALKNDQLEATGYEVFKAQLDDETKNFKTVSRLTGKELYNRNEIKFSDFLRVVYTKEEVESGYKIDNFSTTSMAYNGPDRKMVRGGIEINSGNEGNGQISYLFNRASKVTLNEEGLVRNPEYLLEYGYWGWERIGELLPNEYHLQFVEEANHPPTEASTDLNSNPIINGFELTNLLVDEADVKNGGVPKDGIPAINNPKFIRASEDIWLTKKDMVLGIEINGQSRAYPIKILDRHEAVNDVIGGTPVLISYCPLCGSGMAFDPVIDGQKRTFGISGLLYNSDVLLYDHQSNSLWSQIESQAISGEMSGSKMTHLPTYHMSWEDWKSKFPDSEVMTKETGFNRNYDIRAYKGYDKTPKLLFPVKDQNPYLATKELVIGVSINGKHKAYTLKKLKKNKKRLEDSLGGEKIYIVYHPTSNSATIYNENDQIVASTRLFWFAWYAFHPETELY